METTGAPVRDQMEPLERGRLRSSALAALMAGLLWAPYGIFEMLTPFGPGTVYDPGRGYELVVDRGLFTLYGLPGACALALSAIALLLRFQARAGRRFAAGRVLAWAALGLGGSSLAGVALGLDPLGFGSQAFGTPVLGASALLLAGAPDHRRSRTRLALVGAGGIALIAIWPLVWALEALPALGGALLIGLFGGGWLMVAVDTAASGERDAAPWEAGDARPHSPAGTSWAPPHV